MLRSALVFRLEDSGEKDTRVLSEKSPTPLFYTLRSGDGGVDRAALVPTLRPAAEAKHQAWASELNPAFPALIESYEEAVEESRRLAADLAVDDRSALEQWLRDWGILLPGFYVLGTFAYGYLEGWCVPRAAAAAAPCRSAC